ncbi:sensor histidine kinase [Stenotrophomonas sp. SY1]|uniref:sensor histidine kinase n=1 Tax=Stenotrophomonas sp. SY1 TaxID=477235 RepID=UPI001E45B1C8|nr:sensor histidine kinase [Stenotrophomonas sp. SY1]MCD9085323.1 sensor histidine kinase [Stenotrophomonas sp. SY1]
MFNVVANVKHIGSVHANADGAGTAATSTRKYTPHSLNLHSTLTYGLPLLLGCLLGHLLPGIAQTLGFRLHALWIPGPLLLGWLLFAPRPAWHLCVLAACTGTLLAFALFPSVAVHWVIASLGEFALVVAVAWILLRWRGSRAPLEGYREITLFLLLGCMALPLCSAWWQTLFFDGNAKGPMPGTVSMLALGNCVSYLLVVPTIVNLARIVRSPERRHGWSWRSVGLASLLLCVLGVVWGMHWNDGVAIPLLALAPIPLLVLALIVFGVTGASISMLIVAVLGMQLSVRGLGPFAFSDAEHNLVTAQIWILGAGAALLFLGALAEQKLSGHLKLQQAYRRLGELTGRMLVVQEEERTRIARDLHDDVNQSLAAISIRLSVLRNQIPAADRPSVVELQDQLLSVSNDIRSISHELHPSILRFTGLASALDAFCSKRSARGTLNLRCTIEDTPRLSDDQELSLFRIVQEAINNIDKHARARVAQVLVAIRGQHMVLRIDDDGIGMPTPTRLPVSPGLGMISMEERARLLGGVLLVERSPLGGTRIEVRFPVAAPAQDALAVTAPCPQ